MAALRKLLLLLMIAAGAGWIAFRFASFTRESSPEVATMPTFAATASVKEAQSGLANSASFSDIAENAIRSIVNISSIRVVRDTSFSPFFNDPFFRHFFGDDATSPFAVPRERRQRSLGSGVVVSPEGYILTSNHVVANATSISVVFGDGLEQNATIVGNDPKTDVALIKVENTKTLHPLKIGNSDSLRLAEVVLAIGNPFGVGQTVTQGIVSAIGRANVGIADYEDFIQTDAAINPGNSGGALINLKGELIGINTAILSRSGGYQGIGFAIPINMAKFVMDQLIATGKVERGWIGVRFQTVTSEIAKAFGLDKPKGALITGVFEGSPANKGGVKRGDVILRYKDEDVRNTGHLSKLLSETRIGEKVALQLLRDGKTETASVVMEKQPEQAQQTQRRRRRRR